MAPPKAAKISHRKVIPPKIARCPQGHAIFRYLYAPVTGRKRLRWACDCSLTPMSTK